MRNPKFGQLTAEERIKLKEKSKEDYLKIEQEFLAIGNPSEVAYFKNIPKRFKNSWLKCRLKKITNKSTYIKLKCEECQCFEDLAEGIGNCKTTICPLYNVRPKTYIKQFETKILDVGF
jgi:hypothetical protein